jgi:hypothetical protein
MPSERGNAGPETEHLKGVITDATVDPSGVQKSAIKELERYWRGRQIEVAAHLNWYGTPSSR